MVTSIEGTYNVLVRYNSCAFLSGRWPDGLALAIEGEAIVRSRTEWDAFPFPYTTYLMYIQYCTVQMYQGRCTWQCTSPGSLGYRTASKGKRCGGLLVDEDLEVVQKEERVDFKSSKTPKFLGVFELLRT